MDSISQFPGMLSLNGCSFLGYICFNTLSSFVVWQQRCLHFSFSFTFHRDLDGIAFSPLTFTIKIYRPKPKLVPTEFPKRVDVPS